MAGLRLTRHLPNIGIDEFVTAAPFATAPWLLPHNATSLISQSDVGRILIELRTALWATAPKQRGATPNYAELHPWALGRLSQVVDSFEAGFDNGPHQDWMPATPSLG